MAELKNVLVVCVDRDNDLGRKANVAGPVIGRKKNIAAAVKLALKDPGDSDSNSVFAAVKKFDEVRKLYNNVEVVTLTGKNKSGFESDVRINEQLDRVMEKFPADAIILVSDGAEDDQVMPILQSRAPIISKETVYVKQAKEVESTYYTIKEALKDPAIGGVVFGIPGLILMLYAIVVFLGYQAIFFQTLAFVLGAFLIAKWTGLEDKLNNALGSVTASISLQRTSFPFYIAVIFIIAFGFISAYTNFSTIEPEKNSVEKGVGAFSELIMFAAIASVSFFCGKSIDAVHMKKAFRLRSYILSTVFVLLIWFIIESGKNVVVGKADLNSFIGNIIISFIGALVVYKVTTVLDITKKLTKLLVGLPVYSRDGRWLGKVEAVEKDKNIIEYKDIKTKKLRKLARNEFVFREGKIEIIAQGS